MIDALIESAGADLVRIKNTRSRRHFLIGIKGRSAWMVISRKKPSASQITELKQEKKLRTVAVGFAKWSKTDGVYVFHPKKAGPLAAKWAAVKKSLAKQHPKLKSAAFRDAVLYEPETEGDEEARTPKEQAIFGLEYLGFDIDSAADLKKAVAEFQKTYSIPGEPGVIDDYFLEVLAGFAEQLPVYLDPDEEAKAREEKWQAAKADVLESIDVEALVEEYNSDDDLLAHKADFDAISKGMIGRGISGGGKFTEDDVVAIALSQKAFGISVTGSFDMATQVLSHWTRTRRYSATETTAVPDDTTRERVTGRLFVDDASSGDIQQGYFGDCYFVATLASVADRYPDFIRDKLIREVSPGKFRVTLQRWTGSGFTPTPIDVDADLLLNDDGSPYGAGTGRTGAPRELWAALVEKAYFEFSKKHGIYGGYEAFSDPEYGGRLPGRKACPDLPDIVGIAPPDADLDDVRYHAAILKTQAQLSRAIEALPDPDDDTAAEVFGDQADAILELTRKQRAALRRKLKSAAKTLDRRVLDAKKRKARSSPDEGGVSQFAFQVLFGVEAESDDDFAEGELDADTVFKRIQRNLKKGACITAGSLASEAPEGDRPLLPSPPDFLRFKKPRAPKILKEKDPRKSFKKPDAAALVRYRDDLEALIERLDEKDYTDRQEAEAWEYLDELDEVLKQARKWANWGELRTSDDAGRLFFDHQYVVLDAVEIGGLYFIKLLNPHGASELRGGGADDGVFLLPIDRFMRYYGSLELCTP